MGIMHMYEYILLNDLPGKKNLPANDPFLPLIHHMVSLVKQTERQLDNLCKGGYMSETEKNDYKKLLVNNKKDLQQRFSIMVAIDQYQHRIKK